MKMLDITKKFTEYVGMYIGAGYILSNTMSGHQGEINKVDLIKDEELIRIWINHDRREWSSDKDTWHGETVVLRVSRWIYPAKDMDSWTTVWNQDLEDIIKISYYQVSNKDWYFDNLEEAMDYQRLHYSRYHKSIGVVLGNEYGPVDITSPKTQEIAARYLKRKEGYKRVASSKIIIKRCWDGRLFYKIYCGSNIYHINF